MTFEIRRRSFLKGAVGLAAFSAVGGLASQATAAQTPAKGGKLTIGTQGQAGLGPIDPHRPSGDLGINIANQFNVFEALTKQSNEGGIEMCLAESVTPGDDTATVWVIKIKKGVSFHNGNELKADDVIWASVTQMQAALRRGIVFLLPREGELSLAAAWPPDTELGVTDMTAARWALEKKEPAGNATGTLPNSAFQFRPLTSPSGAIGVVGFQQAGHPLEAGEERVLGAILDQTAVAIDRARLSQESLKQAAKLEGDRFRSALLSSISHDLKTPLATITGAVTSLRQFGDRMTPASRDDLLASIEEEGERLARFVANLLDMTRIEAGSLDPRHDWVDIADVIGAAVQRAAKYFPGRTIETSLADDLPLIRGDSVLLGQVLFNLIDNAVKYGNGEPVVIYARRNGDEAVISVTDLGKGIPPQDLERVFDKFFRRGKADGRMPGTGLGLAIAKGFVEAMGGHIRAESPAQKRRGTRITLRFPVEQADSMPKEVE